ncbi:E3 ubiquitin- ligase SINAT2-like [Olea europaea subsp. europaea]|uniref:RING-type E3 ubiquitin transferase n=1 Tax=Olea europaea subsp. europaea TaxID=158383 RepID=A0A8S0S7K7_OLEEU|nr:E3 ubiquitin- ligase SINAT2-like [Olea europaea subsp. europaea]
MARKGSNNEGVIAPDSSTSMGMNHRVLSKTIVHELLECPICMNIMYPPIHQCSNGHTLCSKCKSKVRSCPICRQELGNIRCLALERVAQSLEVPCRYESLGCHDIFPYKTRFRHEKSCRFRPYNCPYAGVECPIGGNILFLVQHLKNYHQVDMHDGSTFNHRYVMTDAQGVENATWMLTLFNCFGSHFCLHFEAFDLQRAPVYMAFVHFMGEEHDATKFNYSLEVGGNDRKLTWQGVPRSIRDSRDTVRESLDGLIIHRNMTLFFSGGNSQELKLNVTGRIWEIQS